MIRNNAILYQKEAIKFGRTQFDLHNFDIIK